MNTRLSDYTSLETLLLFQSLKSYGVDASVFTKISELLKGNPTVRQAQQYDGSRLNPEALREVYAQLIRDEGRNGNGDVGSSTNLPNGDAQSGSRKRKAPSPPLPTLEEAAQNSALIPRLVEKLYARYRAETTKEIRFLEQHFVKTQQEVQEIERVEREQRFAPEVTNGLPNLARDGPQGAANAVDQNGMTSRTAPGTPATAESIRPPPYAPPPSAQRPDSRPAQPHIAPPNALPNGRLPEIAATGYPTQSRPTPSASPIQTGVARPPSAGLPPDRVLNSPVYGQPSPTVHHSPYGPPPTQSQSASPQSQAAVLASKQSASPMPPPSNPHFASHLQPSPYSAPENQQNYSQPLTPAQQQQRMQTPSRQPVPHHANVSASPGTRPGPQATPNFYSQYPPPNANPPPPYNQHAVPTPPPHAGQIPSHRGGYIMTPFQVNAQPPQHQPHPLQPNRPGPPVVATPPPKAIRQSQKPATAPAYRQTPIQAARPAPLELLRLLSTPPAFRPGARRPTPLSVPTPTSATTWKTRPASSLPQETDRSPSVSPVNDVAPRFSLPEAASTASKGRPVRKPRATPSRTDEAADDDAPSARGGRRQTRRNRGASVTSSAVESSVRGRTRSHSVASHADPTHEDVKSARRVKDEPFTPGTQEDVLPGIEAPSSLPPPRRGRPRQSTTTTAPSAKRKRSIRSSSDGRSSTGPAATPVRIVAPPNSGTTANNQIIAPRHFSKMSQPLMNDITSHKHASLFSHPVKERDAEGYHDIIRRPQDLKSIRTAVQMGARAVATAAAAETPSAAAASPGPGASSTSGAGATGGGSNILLAPSAEVMPPRAIVNSAQLEKEIVRMFANAVMFNAGEEGVVEMAREMYDSVQTAVTNWRSAERRGESEEGVEGKDVGVKDGAKEEVDVEGPREKRRRV